jgi:hypothetical protein
MDTLQSKITLKDMGKAGKFTDDISTSLDAYLTTLSKSKYSNALVIKNLSNEYLKELNNYYHFNDDFYFYLVKVEASGIHYIETIHELSKIAKNFTLKKQLIYDHPTDGIKKATNPTLGGCKFINVNKRCTYNLF